MMHKNINKEYYYFFLYILINFDHKTMLYEHFDANIYANFK